MTLVTVMNWWIFPTFSIVINNIVRPLVNSNFCRTGLYVSDTYHKDAWYSKFFYPSFPVSAAHIKKLKNMNWRTSRRCGINVFSKMQNLVMIDGFCNQIVFEILFLCMTNSTIWKFNRKFQLNIFLIITTVFSCCNLELFINTYPW